MNLMGILLMAASTLYAQTESPAEAEFKLIRDAYLAQYKPLVIGSETAWWEAATTGEQAAFDRRKEFQNKLIELHADKDRFSKLRALKATNQVKDPILGRELDVMFRNHATSQGDPAISKKIVELETEVEQIFNAHRGEIDGKPASENEIRDILANGTDPAKAEKAWKAYMQVGAKVESQLKELVTLRNKLAKSVGWENFFVMKLNLQEIDPDELRILFDELDQLTKFPFEELKKEIDAAQAKRFGIAVDQLRPWHFGDLFFQAAPETEEVNLDDIYKNVDLAALAKDYYASLGTPADDILARGDLYEKPKKSPHAFASNLNRDDDIRILCNLQPNLYWADTLIHELGHGVYDKYIRKDVPFLLHEPSHSLTTEGFAMMVGAVVKNEDFLAKAVKVPGDQAAKLSAAARKALRAEKLTFCRWTQVMMRFEMGMYSNPDQNLGELWWNLKKKYQLLPPPDDVNRPDYGAKVHIVTHPVYYHSYMMGELFASQLHAHIAKNVLGLDDPRKTSFYGQKAVGEFWKDKVFGPGNTLYWNALTRNATGEQLTAKAFAKFYVTP